MYAVTPDVIQSRQNKEAGPKTTFEPKHTVWRDQWHTVKPVLVAIIVK